MRVTIDRKFTIKNSTAIAAGENATACRTIASTDGMYVTDEATDKYTHKPVVANNQTAAEMNVYLVNDQYTRCNCKLQIKQMIKAFLMLKEQDLQNIKHNTLMAVQMLIM